MAKTLESLMDDGLKTKCSDFNQNMNAEMHYKSELSSDSMSFDWVDEIELACPYIENIARNPKLTLINDENTVKIEKARKITVSSVKDLSRHTQFIEKIDPRTRDVQPSKILDVRSEETLNIYENRFLYSLINELARFVSRKQEMLNQLESKNSKNLEYMATTRAGNDKINIELKITADELPKDSNGSDFAKEIENIKLRVNRINDYITSWQRTDLMKLLEKARIPFVSSPIKKTNLILKNPNFQMATRLWDFIQRYSIDDCDNSKNGLDTDGNGVLKSLLNDSFLMDYFVLDSISSSKKEQKNKLAKYAVIMINEQIKRTIALLLNSGIKITEEEILSMISNEIENEKTKRLIGESDVKKKFKSAMEEYLDKTEDYL